jgi:hypothetical protein
MAFFIDEAIYHNMPMLKLTDHAQIRAFIDKTEWMSWKVLNQKAI